MAIWTDVSQKNPRDELLGKARIITQNAFWWYVLATGGAGREQPGELGMEAEQEGRVMLSPGDLGLTLNVLLIHCSCPTCCCAMKGNPSYGGGRTFCLILMRQQRMFVLLYSGLTDTKMSLFFWPL
jgi:hypothetical protein